ncbi:MaoC family dehydratase N-terminal domain-containing protein [Myxococcota bacterium]|nr:MaoC family dehydratase N-terminal domain-containing protein [Myxococcota bacterium]MCZ7618271.1 MaoC/PaaZ C-terminal domain-containing protein [Myxococcota bacterium]
MPIDPGAVGAEGTPTERSWNFRDAILYALGVGCGTDDLQFSTEKNQLVLPTFSVIVGMGGIPFDRIGKFNFAMLVHGEQAFEVYGAIPPNGTVRTKGRVAGIYDKGKGALVVFECESVDAETGELRFKNRMSAFIRGEGGFGGERGPAQEPFEVPSRKPDHEVTYQTRPDQALLYRLSGDMNPLHSDPDIAKIAGFPKPILHGLCTYGFTGRALLASLCGNDPARFRSMEGRFSKPVFPGEALTVKLWIDGSRAVFQTFNPNGDVVLDNGRCTFTD